ncbi:MAG: hypothetical protein D6800_05990, partial [Candidatus Zixiibacteriota bacterium]
MSRFTRLLPVALLALVPIIGCNDSPTDSGGTGNLPDTSGPVTHYEMYLLVRDAVGSVIAVYDAPADTLLDTFPLPANYTNLAVTPDQKLLLVSNDDGNNAIAVRLDTLSLFATGGRAGRYFFDGGRDLGVAVARTGLFTFELSTFASRDSLVRPLG